MEENPFLTRLYLKEYIDLYHWDIGDHTYGAPNVLEKEHGRLQVGRFCSIAMNVSLILGGHRLDSLSTYPFRSFFGFWPGSENSPNDHEDRGGITIGNDVWISSGVTILAGSNVSDGAVLGADTVISGFVEPYAIMVGNPARMIRKRFDDETVKGLLAVAWWAWPDDQIIAEMELICSGNIRGFLEKFFHADRPEA